MEDETYGPELELGQRNARVIERATDHCTLMKFVPVGAGGMLEEVSGLPLNMRRIECPAAISNMSGMQLESLAFEFYAEHCDGCELRSPTGRVPNLESEVLAAHEREAGEKARQAERLAERRTGWAERVERRQQLRAKVDTAMASALDDLDLLDGDPGAPAEGHQVQAARRRLTALAARAPQQFDATVVDELFAVIAAVGITELLAPLRYLTTDRAALAPRLITAALSVLKLRADAEAGRCLSDHPDLVDWATVETDVITSIVVLAGSKTSEDHFLSGPLPVVVANDPGPLRLLATSAPAALAGVLRSMLPRPVPAQLEVAAHHRVRQVSDFDRRAAAGAIEYLAATHLEVALSLFRDLAVSLAVAPADRYDTGTVGSAERALGRMFIEDPSAVGALITEAGAHASNGTREHLVGSVRHALNMVDTDYVHRRPQDPMAPPEQSAAVVDAGFDFLLARTDAGWGYQATFESAEQLAHLVERNPEAFGRRIDSLLGAFVSLRRLSLQDTAPSPLVTPQVPTMLSAIEATSRRAVLFQASQRLLKAVQAAAGADPCAACNTIAVLITNERDTDLGTAVVDQLILALGKMGARYGSEPRVIQAILPTLHTYLVDAEPGPRSAALEAWTDIGARHSLPSTLGDLLPALVGDPYVVMINALLGAAQRLHWPDPVHRATLAMFTIRLLESLDVTDHFDSFVSALDAARRLVVDPAQLAVVEKAALSRVPDLEWWQASKLIDQGWQPEARVTSDLAKLWLTDASRHTYGLRQRDEAEEALKGLLDCGTGLIDIEARIVKAGVSHSPESPFGSLEYAEVLARVELRHGSVQLLEQALGRIPDVPARSAHRALVSLALENARLQLVLHGAGDERVDDGLSITSAIGSVDRALAACAGALSSEATWLERYLHACAIRVAIVCELFDVTPPEATLNVLSGAPDGTFGPPHSLSDVAARIRARAERLRLLSSALSKGGASTGTATHRGVAVTASLLAAIAHLLEADAAELDADLAQAEAHRKAATRRATAIDLGGFRDDDPLVIRARDLIDTLHSNEPGWDLPTLLQLAAALPAPLLFVRSPKRASGPRPWRPPADPEPFGPNVAVALVSIDDKLLTGPAIIDPGLTHTLTLRVQTDPWPEWAERLDAELLSTLNDTELERPTFTWRPEHGVDEAFEGSGSLHVRYQVPTGQNAPPVLIRLTWRGVDADGVAHSSELDVTGHREFRVRPFDPARDATTQSEVFDEHLLAIYDKLATAGYPHGQLQAFARLLNAISRVGLAMTWDKKYRRGQSISERQFHDDLHAALLADPSLEGRVERGTAHALGYLDTRHDGITAELKVARDQPVTQATAPKYIGQPTQYAAADGTRLSILVILDMSRKMLPIGTPENYLFVLGPEQHGMTDAHSPSIVVTLVVNGNLPAPSSWSRRKTPVRPS